MLLGGRTRRSGLRKRRLSEELQRAHAMHDSGNVAEARSLCEGILSRDPVNADAHALLGVVHGEQGDLELALTHFTEAIRISPEAEIAHVGLGNIYRLRDAPEDAAASYRRALAIDDRSPVAHFGLGMALRQTNDLRGAIEHLARAVVLSPGLSEAAIECARLQIHLGDHEGAVALIAKALNANRSIGGLHATLGLAHQKMHNPQQALKCYEEARALGWSDAEFMNNRGYVLQELGRLPEALACYDEAIALQPDFPVAKFYRALARLLTGDYVRGWLDYETRLISEDRPRRAESYPRWSGERLEGRTILVWGEQGLGDEIMFASCLSEIIGAARRCVIECEPKLETLLRRSFPRARVYAARPDRSIPDEIKAEAIDCEVPIGSLPLYLRRSVGDFPRHHGYLRADPALIAKWRGRLASLGPGVKVGISWKGGTQLTRSPLRSVPLPALRPILSVPDVTFISLQYGNVTDEIEAYGSRYGRQIVHWQEAIENYDECAALVSALDLVISVQTAVVHLTGALGRTAWAMVPYGPEWRYGASGDGMPWYPALKIFRQASFGDWDPVIDRISREVATVRGGAGAPS